MNKIELSDIKALYDSWADEDPTNRSVVFIAYDNGTATVGLTGDTKNLCLGMAQALHGDADLRKITNATLTAYIQAAFSKLQDKPYPETPNQE